MARVPMAGLLAMEDDLTPTCEVCGVKLHDGTPQQMFLAGGMFRFFCERDVPDDLRGSSSIDFSDDLPTGPFTVVGVSRV